MTFALGALLFGIALLLRAIDSSGAVPPAEFAPAAIVFRGALPLAGAGLGVLLLDGWRRLCSGLGLHVLATLTGTALVLGGVFDSRLLPIGIAIGGLGVLASRPRASFALPGRGETRAEFAALAQAMLALIPAGFVLVALEWLVRTRGLVADGLVGEDLVLPYLGAAAGFGASAILKAMVSLLRVLLPLGVGLYLLSRRPRAWTPAVATVLLALLVVLEVVQVLRLSLRDELDQLGLNPHLLALAGAGLLLLLPLSEAILGSCRRLSDLPRALATLPGGPGRLSGPAINLVFLLGFLPLLYPRVEDYRERFFDCVALLAILFLASLLVRLGLGRLRRLRLAALGLLVLGGVAFATLGQRPDLRLIAFEYSRFGAFGASAPWSRWVADEAALGRRAPDLGAPWLLEVAPAPATGTSADRPPIVILLWDAARPDRMSLHGYRRPTTPRLDELAARALVFERARSSATATTLAVRNMLSGAYNSRFMLSEEHEPFLVQALAAGGYDDFFVTVTDNDFNGISDESFLRGWDAAAYRSFFRFRSYPNRDHIKPDAEKIDDLLEHLAERLASRGDLKGSFAYVHLTGTHTPWRNDDPVMDFGKTALDRYDGEMRKLDHQLGRIVDFLADAGELDRSLLVVTSDHGTGLGEHGRLAGFLPYEEQLRIPLVMLVPGEPGRRIAGPVTNLDVAPTVVDLAGCGAWPGEGRSLRPLLEGGSIARPPFVAFCAFQDSYAIYDPDWRFKLHHHRGRRYEALFDLANDPGEKRNVLDAEPEMARRLRTQLDAFLWEGRARYGNPYHYRAWQPPR